MRRQSNRHPIYRHIGERLREAGCIYRLGEIELTESQPDAARSNFESALALYRSIHHPCPMGIATCRLAHLEAHPATGRDLLTEAADTWHSIDREDLIDALRAEFPGEF